MIDESKVTIVDENIQGGYLEVHLIYFINDCVDIELYVKDYERGVTILNMIADKLRDLDLSEDIKYNEKYQAEVDAHIEWKKEHKEKQRKRIVA